MAVGITIAALAVLLGGNSGDGPSHFLIDVEKQIKSVIKDKIRRKELLLETGELSKKLQSLEKMIEGHLKDYVGIHSTYKSTEKDFDAITEQLASDQRKTANLILDTREKMRELMTREEWNAVFQSSDNRNEKE